MWSSLPSSFLAAISYLWMSCVLYISTPYFPWDFLLVLWLSICHWIAGLTAHSAYSIHLVALRHYSKKHRKAWSRFWYVITWKKSPSLPQCPIFGLIHVHISFSNLCQHSYSIPWWKWNTCESEMILLPRIPSTGKSLWLCLQLPENSLFSCTEQAFHGVFEIICCHFVTKRWGIC